MKNIKPLILFLFVFAITINAQQQVKTGNGIITKKENAGSTYENGNKIKSNNAGERIITTAVVIGELGLLLAILFYWKKTRGENKAENKTVFKRNIQALRNEKIRYFENEKLSNKRKLLQTKIKRTRINGKYITEKAKRHSVSKGEIFLAARIKQLQQAKT